jgi:hypothetical protein
MLIILGKREDLTQFVRDSAHAEYLMSQPGRPGLRHLVLNGGRHAVAWEEYHTMTWTHTGNVFDYDSAMEWASDNPGWEVYKYPDWINEEELAQRHFETKRKLGYNRIT